MQILVSNMVMAYICRETKELECAYHPTSLVVSSRYLGHWGVFGPWFGMHSFSLITWEHPFQICVTLVWGGNPLQLATSLML